jgi:fatty-acid peroxygenase
MSLISTALDWPGHPYQMIANGGGSYDKHHRCSGEQITMALLQVALQSFTQMVYEVPLQNLAMRLRQIPCRPVSGFVIRLP